MNDRFIKAKSFWHGSALPAHVWLCLKSFVDHGHTYDLYVYDDVAVPAGVRLCDASEILSRSRIFYYQTGPGAGSLGAFANLFRYHLLHQQGGWWFDTDVLCLSPSLPDVELVFGWEAQDGLGNAVIKLPAGHELARGLVEKTEAIILQRKEALAWGETGPTLFHQMLEDAKLTDIAHPVSMFYPLHWSEHDIILDPDRCSEVEQRVADSATLHLWNELFRRSGADMNARPPDGSYLLQCYVRHGVTHFQAEKNP